MSIPRRPVAVLDTNVLLPQMLRDVLLRCASGGLFRAHWSVTTLDELLRNLGPVAGVSPANAERLVGLMRMHFEDAEVRRWPALRQAALAISPEDRHVLAAAIQIRADVIVTENTRHFPAAELARWKITACTADEFLTGLLADRPDELLEVLRAMSARLTKPPLTPEQIAFSLRHVAPVFARTAAQQLSAT